MGCPMRIKTIPASEIKRRGIRAVDEQLAEYPAVHVIANNRPKYVILTEERYGELLEEIDEAAELRVAESVADYRAGKVKTYGSVNELMAAIDAADDG